MLSRIFPRQIDNSYRGHWLAIWILVLAAGMKGAQAVTALIEPLYVATGPDAIPIDRYGADAQATFIGIFSLLAMYVLVVPLLSALAVVRYRTMIPLMYLLLLATQLGNVIMRGVHPFPRLANPEAGFAGSSFSLYMNLLVLAVTAIGLALSLKQKAEIPVQPRVQGAS